MTNSSKLHNMTDNQLAAFLTRLCTNPDWLDWLFKCICNDNCPIDGKICHVHEQDNWCNHSIEQVFLQWLKTEAS